MKCLGEIIHRGDGVEYVHGYRIPKGHPDKALLQPCPNEVAGTGAGLAGCGCYCARHCGGPIHYGLGNGQDHGDDVAGHIAGLPDGRTEAAKLAAVLLERAEDDNA